MSLLDSRLNLFRHLGEHETHQTGVIPHMTSPIPAPAQPAPTPTVIAAPVTAPVAPAPVASAPVAPAPVAAHSSFWATFFQKLMATEEALVPIFVPNDAKAQGIAAAVLVTTSTFASIFGVHPTTPTTNGQ